MLCHLDLQTLGELMKSLGKQRYTWECSCIYGHHYVPVVYCLSLGLLIVTMESRIMMTNQHDVKFIACTFSLFYLFTELYYLHYMQ